MDYEKLIDFIGEKNKLVNISFRVTIRHIAKMLNGEETTISIKGQLYTIKKINGLCDDCGDKLDKYDFCPRCSEEEQIEEAEADLERGMN